MRKAICIVIALLMTMPAFGEKKQKGTTTLKDFQPAGTPGKKQKQQFDFIFDASGAEYTCRTSSGTKMKAIEWPVGSEISFEIDKEKGKIKNTKGKKIDCTIMRVDPIKAAATQ